MEKFLNYTLGLEGISPSEPICGGVQGEHRATALCITPDRTFCSAVEQKCAEGKEAFVRLDFITEAGELIKGEERAFEDLALPFYLTSQMTASGLDASVLVRVLLKTEEGAVIGDFCKAQIKLFFEAAPIGLSLQLPKKEPQKVLAEALQAALLEIRQKGEEAEQKLEVKLVAVSEQAQTSAGHLKKVIATAEQTEETAREIALVAEELKAAEENCSGKANEVKTLITEAARLVNEASRSAAQSREYAEEVQELVGGAERKQNAFAKVLEQNGNLILQSPIDADRPAWLEFGNGFFRASAMRNLFGSENSETEILGMRLGGDEGNVSVGNCRIRNLAAPVYDKDAVNKVYLDNLVGDVEAALDNIIVLQQSLIGGDGV